MIAKKSIKKLKNTVLIDLLFSTGKTVSSGALVVHYLRDLKDVNDLFLGVTVSKKYMFLAVHRNLIKRQLREAVRINKVYIKENIPGGLYMVLFKSTKKISSSEVNDCLLKAFEKISSIPLNT